MIVAIACVDKNWAIGKNNDLLFNIPEDMKHFRETTANSIVVMGEHTLLSFPGKKPLKNRTNIVLCREGHNYENCICIYTLEELINVIKCLSITNTVYIIGGGFIYSALLPYYDKAIITKVDSIDDAATVFFPNLDEMKEFVCCVDRELEDDSYKCKIKFTTYYRERQN